MNGEPTRDDAGTAAPAVASVTPGRFEGFVLDHVDVGEAKLRVRYGGDGPPVVLLHGHPRTHMTWGRVAADLANEFTVVCPDLRGYGDSRLHRAPPAGDHSAFSKRAMATDIVELMASLGHARFAVVGHDRGAYVAHRLAVDHDVVAALVVMDAVPIGEALARCDARFASAWWHWFFLGQTAKPAERVINADPDAWYRVGPDAMGEEAYEDLRRALHDPEVVHAMCEDYRAGLRDDRMHDEEDRAAGRRAGCPTLIAWAEYDDLEDLYGDPVAVWASWLEDLRGGARIPAGHHVAEEAPEETAQVLRTFLRGVL